jgi:hypothetical protein
MGVKTKDRKQNVRLASILFEYKLGSPSCILMT